MSSELIYSSELRSFQCSIFIEVIHLTLLNKATMEEEVQPPEASTETSEAQETNPENAGNDNISDSQNDTKDQTDENEDLFGSDDEPSKPNAEEEKITDEIKVCGYSIIYQKQDEVITDTAEPEEPQQEVLEYSELPRPQDSKVRICTK